MKTLRLTLLSQLQYVLVLRRLARLLPCLLPCLLLYGNNGLAAEQPVPPSHDDRGWDLSTIDHQQWQCEYCLQPAQSQQQVGINIGYLDDDAFRFGNLTGIDKGVNFSPEFSVWQFEPNQYFWSLDLQSQSTQAHQFELLFRHANQWKVSARYQDFALQQYDNLYTPFTLQDHHHLQLPSDWQPLANNLTLSTAGQPHNLTLAVDWQRFNLGLSLKSDDIRYSMNYQRIEKSGTAPASTNQLVQAFYIPMPVDQSIDNIDLAISSQYGPIHWSLNYGISHFSNQFDSVIYDVPFVPVLEGANQGQTALSPDNKASKISANINWQQPNSHLKVYLAMGEHSQRNHLLPYTTTAALNAPLPTDITDLKVDTQQINVRYQWQPLRAWTFSAKYQYHDRDNRSPIWQFTPVSNDVYLPGEVSNIAYDIRRKKAELSAKWRFNGRQFFTLTWQDQRKRRDYELISKTHDQGVIGKLNLPFANNSLLTFNAERFDRTLNHTTQWQTIDLVNNTENPLLQKFTFADRIHHRYDAKYTLPWRDFGLHLAGDIQRNDYQDNAKQTNPLGLAYSHSRSANINLDWRISDNQIINGFYQWQTIDSAMNVADLTLNNGWRGLGSDRLTSYGINYTAAKLFDLALTFDLKLQRSNGRSDMTIYANHSLNSSLNNGLNNADPLPALDSEWTAIVADVSYQIDEHWRLKFSYQYDKFASADYQLAGVLPNSVHNLLTFGALSYNYQVNYILLNLNHTF